jgi:hypothetical protein
MAAWPRWADPAHDPPYAGWPVRVDQVDNYARGASGYLPTVRVIGLREPVIQVVDEAAGEIVYTLRLAGATFTPMVFASGPHTVRIGEPGTPRWRAFAHLRPGVSGSDTLEVSFE